MGLALLEVAKVPNEGRDLLLGRQPVPPSQYLGTNPA